MSRRPHAQTGRMNGVKASRLQWIFTTAQTIQIADALEGCGYRSQRGAQGVYEAALLRSRERKGGLGAAQPPARRSALRPGRRCRLLAARSRTSISASPGPIVASRARDQACREFEFEASGAIGAVRRLTRRRRRGAVWRGEH